MTIPIHVMRRQGHAPRGAYLLFGSLLAVIAVVALIPGLIGPSLDAAVFSVVGERVAHGAIPYADVFDHKPPALYLLIALGQVLAGSIGTWKVSWILSVAAVALTGVVTADTLRQIGWRRTAWIAGGLAAAELASFPLALGGGLSETASVLPAVLALRLVVVGPPRAGRRLGAGLLAGLATAVSLQAAPAALAVTVAAALRGPDGARWRARLMDALWVAAGGAAVWAGLLIFFGTSNTTLAAFDAVVAYNGAFRNLARLDSPPLFEAIHALLIIAPLVVLAALGRVLVNRGPRNRALEGAALVWLAASLAFVVYQGRLEVHYAALLVPPLALLAPAGMQLRIRGSVRSLIPPAVGAALMVAAIVVSGWLIVTETADAVAARSEQMARTDAVASWVDRNVPQSGSLFVWGNTPDLYLQIPRAPASEYVYLLPLTTPGFVDASIVERVRLEFVANPPAVIIDAGSTAPGAAGALPLLIDRPVGPSDGRTMDLLDPIRAFVAAHYRLAAVVDGWPVYLPS